MNRTCIWFDSNRYLVFEIEAQLHRLGIFTNRCESQVQPHPATNLSRWQAWRRNHNKRVQIPYSWLQLTEGPQIKKLTQCHCYWLKMRSLTWTPIEKPSKKTGHGSTFFVVFFLYIHRFSLFRSSSPLHQWSPFQSVSVCLFLPFPSPVVFLAESTRLLPFPSLKFSI